jgi:hypothetical protein
MTSNESSLSEKVQASFRELTTAAKNLNQVSDELSQTISFLDAVLQKLNLGVSAWVPVTGDEDPNGHYWSRDIGYAKVENHWGIALRNIHGSYDDPDGEVTTDDLWLFNDAPRWLRAEGVAHIAALFEKLTRLADDTAKRIQKSSKEAKELAGAIKAAHK